MLESIFLGIILILFSLINGVLFLFTILLFLDNDMLDFGVALEY
jgi:hypothetical protein